MRKNKLHSEVTSVVSILETLAHGVVSTNEPEAHDLMKAVLIDAVFKMEAIFAFEEEMNAAFYPDLRDAYGQ